MTAVRIYSRSYWTATIVNKSHRKTVAYADDESLLVRLCWGHVRADAGVGHVHDEEIERASLRNVTVSKRDEAGHGVVATRNITISVVE